MSILVAAAALPASGALFYYKFTGDPTLRPFSLTKNSLLQGDAPQALHEILVRVDWGQNVPPSIRQDDVRKILGKALSIYDIDYRVQFRGIRGADVQVYFLVGSSQIGPYPFQRVSQGIPAALAAFQTMK